jgi:DNA-binding transcriptional regulator YdaS (Cro superfamily)
MAVYFVQAGEAGPIKIGYAADVSRRLTKMQADCPIKLRIVSTIPAGSRVTEKALHSSLSPHLIFGEWFEPAGPVTAAAEAAEPWVGRPRKRRTKADHGLEAAVAAAGGVGALAKVLGIASPSLSGWKRVPAERVIQIERLLGGAVSRHTMRPDLYPWPADDRIVEAAA